ncbi:MAG: DNA mismatch repair protein MutS [Bacilli bacterium]
MKRNEVKYEELSPMMQQYLDIKNKHLDELLFYRIGDFYELFFEDGETASRELELTLTGKNAGLKERIPMCGVPFHSVKPYIEKLIDKGYKVAICEQLEDPKSTKGMVKRGVVQVISRGTLTDYEMMKPKDNNYIASILDFGNSYVLTYSDISTGEMNSLTIKRDDITLMNEILNLGVKEVILTDSENSKLINDLKNTYGIEISYSNSYLESDYEYLYKDIKDSKIVMGIKHLLYYLVITNMKDLSHITNVEIVDKDEYLSMDIHTVRNLELFETLRLKERTYSLIWLLDKCKTAMGSRKLKSWLLHPLKDKNELNKRYEKIEKLNTEFIIKEQLREKLYEVYDLERLCGKLNTGSLNARDLLQIKNSLAYIPEIKEYMRELGFNEELDELRDIYELLEKAINPDAPITLKDGALIQNGYNSDLDELRSIRSGGKDFIASFEEKLKNDTGIKNLKVGYNKIFGYYIEVSKGQSKMVQTDFGWERRQTLTNCERFISPELKEKEALILNAEERIIDIEYQLFMEIKETVRKKIFELKRDAEILSELDAILSLAVCAEEYNLVKPVLTDKHEIIIKDGRHPVVEVVSKNGYVANDCIMKENTNTLLITGPNMSGKSTFMRQLAIIILMAQMGSYVPAKEATLPIIDKIFTRIGASDDLVSGESTFMVEMKEACNALLNATKNSLILFDELGRGTATYDGMSLAQAILEYVNKNIGCKTLFSTHYHELTALSKEMGTIKNVHVDAHEENGEVTFLHKVVSGPIDKSYGIHVAKLAHMPEELLKRASEILSVYEAKDTKNKKVEQVSFFDDEEAPKEQKPKVKTEIQYINSEVEEELKNINVDNLRPIDALNSLYKLKEIMDKKESVKQ